MNTNIISLKAIIGASFMFISITVSAQLKVDAAGNIGMGTTFPSPEFKCHIKSRLLISNYPETPFNELRQLCTIYGSYIGASSDEIRFWVDNGSGYNKLYAQAYYTASDSKIKSNIQLINNGLSLLMKINAYSYNIEENYTNKTFSEKKNFGFISDEVFEVFPEVSITDTAEGIRLMDYNQITPLLVASIKEQQHIIDSLRMRIENLETNFDMLLGEVRIQSTENNDEEIILYQNTPNPFNEKTTIKYNIESKNYLSGSILIFDMNGTLLKSYPTSKGENELTISGSVLNAGMYMYTLLVNGKEVDTKRMILVK